MRPKKSYDVSLTHIEDFSNYGDDGYLELSKCDTCMTKTHEKRHERRLCVVCVLSLFISIYPTLAELEEGILMFILDREREREPIG